LKKERPGTYDGDGGEVRRPDEELVVVLEEQRPLRGVYRRRKRDIS